MWSIFYYSFWYENINISTRSCKGGWTGLGTAKVGCFPLLFLLSQFSPTWSCNNGLPHIFHWMLDTAGRFHAMNYFGIYILNLSLRAFQLIEQRGKSVQYFIKLNTLLCIDVFKPFTPPIAFPKYVQNLSFDKKFI